MIWRRSKLTRALATSLDVADSSTDASAFLGNNQDNIAELGSLLATARKARKALHAPIPPPPQGLRLGRARLLAAAARSTSRRRVNLSQPFRSAAQTAALIAVLIVLITPLSPKIVHAARASMPGELLYPLKLHVERVQFSGAEQPDVRLALGLAFLGERVAEVQELTNQHQAIDDQTTVEVQLLVNQILTALAQTPEPAMPEMLRYASLQFQNYLRVLDALEETATAINAGALGQITRSTRKGHQVIYHALLDPTAFQSAYGAGRPELFLLPGENPLGGSQSSEYHPLNTEWEKPQ